MQALLTELDLVDARPEERTSLCDSFGVLTIDTLPSASNLVVPRW